jgi:hypothetical protein
MSPDTNQRKSLKDAFLNSTKRSVLLEDMSVMMIVMSLKSVGQRLLTGALSHRMMNTDVWMVGNMHDDRSPLLFSLFLLPRVKFVQFEQRHMQLLIAESPRKPGIIENPLEPASGQMQNVSDRDLQSYVTEDPPLLWRRPDRPFGL